MPAKRESDWVTLHCIHGSLPKQWWKEKSMRLGGLLWGHVEIQIDDKVYGFEYVDKKNVHIFPRKKSKYNAKFTLKTLAERQTETQDEKITSVTFSTSSEQKYLLTEIYTRYLRCSPYDYAFLGTRCALSACEILQEVAILPHRPHWYNVLLAFSPSLWRKQLCTYAKKHHLLIERQKGSPLKIWE